MSCACAALVDNVFAHRSKNGIHCLECVFISSNKNIQRGIARTHVAASDGRVERVDAALLCLCIDALSKRGRGGRHIGGVCARLEVCKDAVRAEVDLLYILWIADDGNDGVLSACACARAVGILCTPCNENVRLRLCAVVDRELIACIHEMPRHCRAHDPKSDESNFFHCAFLRFVSLLCAQCSIKSCKKQDFFDEFRIL